MLELAKRLPSKIYVQVVHSDYDEAIDSFIIGDNQFLSFFNNEDKLIGFTNYSARPESRKLIEQFQQLWAHHSAPNENLRNLTL